jgi:hypothetical protein
MGESALSPKGEEGDRRVRPHRSLAGPDINRDPRPDAFGVEARAGVGT